MKAIFKKITVILYVVQFNLTFSIRNTNKYHFTETADSFLEISV